MENLQDLMIEITTSINTKKDGIINERLLILDPNFNIEKEKNRRFKKLICEHRPKSESYYFNDGSDDGVHLVTFFYNDFELSKDLKFDFSLKYSFAKPKF